jgi:hypothetical protein
MLGYADFYVGSGLVAFLSVNHDVPISNTDHMPPKATGITGLLDRTVER